MRRVRQRVGGEAGYSLVELLIVLIILGVVIGALADGFTSASRAEVDQTRRASDQQAARQALDRMRKDIHCASGANAAQILDSMGNPTNAWLLNLQIPGGYCSGVTDTSSSGVQWCTAAINGSTTRFGLYRTVQTPAGVTCNAADADFQVDYITKANIFSTAACVSGQVPTVSVDISVNRDYPKRPSRTYDLQDTIALRNAHACP